MSVTVAPTSRHAPGAIRGLARLFNPLVMRLAGTRDPTGRRLLS